MGTVRCGYAATVAAAAVVATTGCGTGAAVSAGAGRATAARVAAAVQAPRVVTRPAGPAAPVGARTTRPNHLRGVHDATQLVVVTASGYGTTHATLRVYNHRSDGWHLRFGPWSVHIGRNGFAPRGDKREGDGRTPTGSYLFPFMFGVAANPGVHYRYRRALSTSRWDDDSSSPRYNEWVDIRQADPGRAPEDMRVLPVYRYGAVIGYNTTRRTPGMGSAIFLHVSDGNATAGCVSVAQSHLVRLLTWLRPSRHARIIMGTRSAITR